MYIRNESCLERKEYFEKAAEEAFKDFRIECLEGDPSPDVDPMNTKLFRCFKPGTNNMSFYISFSKVGIVMNGDARPFHITEKRTLAWLLSSVHSRGYLMKKTRYRRKYKEFIPREVDLWLKAEEREIREDYDYDDDVLKEKLKEIDEWKDEWKLIKLTEDHPEIMEFKWCDYIYGKVDDIGDLVDSWSDWNPGIHWGYQQLKFFVDIYKRTYDY